MQILGTDEIIFGLSADAILLFVVVLLGAAFRFFLPFWTKIRQNKLEWNQRQLSYILNTIIAGIWAEIITLWGYSQITPSTNGTLFTLLLAFVIGFGGPDLQEKVLKFLDKDGKRVFKKSAPTSTDLNS